VEELYRSLYDLLVVHLPPAVRLTHIFLFSPFPLIWINPLFFQLLIGPIADIRLLTHRLSTDPLLARITNSTSEQPDLAANHAPFFFFLHAHYFTQKYFFSNLSLKL
jgi:hypothetical protein